MNLPYHCGFWGRDSSVVPVRNLVSPQFTPDLAPEVLKTQAGEACMKVMRLETERRKWARLPLAIPVFVRSRDGEGKEFLEFATALNVSAGGMLVAVRRVLPPVAQIQLEIPSAPVATLAALPRTSRDLQAKALRTTPAEGYYLLGLKFSRPLLQAGQTNGKYRRKEPAPV